jgi:hypothetical protein
VSQFPFKAKFEIIDWQKLPPAKALAIEPAKVSETVISD